MYSKEITYIDYDGNERTETFLFHLNKAELIEMDMSESGGLEKTLRKIIAEQDGKRIFEMLKMIIMKSYGVKSLDGRQFVKSDELSKEFIQTEAYSELVMEMFKDADKAAEFINNIVPKDVADAVANSETNGSIQSLPMA